MTKSALQIARAAYQPKLPKALKGTVKAANCFMANIILKERPIHISIYYMN